MIQRVHSRGGRARVGGVGWAAVPGGGAGGQSDGGGASDALHRAALRIQSRYRGYRVRKVPSHARLHLRSAPPALAAFGSAPPPAAVFTRTFTSGALALPFTAGIEVQLLLRFGVQAYHTYKLGGGGVTDFQYSPALFGVDLSGDAAAPRPRARSNAQMAIAGDTLWLLGGAVEVGSRTRPPHTTSREPDWCGVHFRLRCAFPTATCFGEIWQQLSYRLWKVVEGR